MKHYVGLDVSQEETHICVIDEHDQVAWQGKCDTTPCAIGKLIQQHAPHVEKIGLETGNLSTYLWHGLNDMGWNSPEYDGLVRAAGREQDAAQRRALLEQAERLMLADYPLIPLYFYVSKALVKPTVGGYEQNVMNVHPSRHLYLIEP